MMRALGSDRRLPRVPAASKNAPMLAAIPRLHVPTSDRHIRMAS